MIRKQRAYSYNLFIKLLNNQFFSSIINYEKCS